MASLRCARVRGTSPATVEHFLQDCPTHQNLGTETWAGLHDDNVPDRPSAKVAPAGCPLATMALKIKTVTIPKGGLHGRSRHPIWDVSAAGLICTRLAEQRVDSIEPSIEPTIIMPASGLANVCAHGTETPLISNMKNSFVTVIIVVVVMMMMMMMMIIIITIIVRLFRLCIVSPHSPVLNILSTSKFHLRVLCCLSYFMV